MTVSARQIRVGVNKATSGSWGTGAAVATAVGAGDGVYVFDDLGIQISRNYSRDESAGQAFIGNVMGATTSAISGAIPTFLHYHDSFQNVLWALTLGTGGTAPTQLGTTTAYTNTFEPAGSAGKNGNYATIVRDVSHGILEVPGAKFTGFELAFGQDGRGEIRWSFLGDTEKRDSTINTSSQIAALTFPTLGLRAHFDDVTFRVNAQSGGALAASDAVKITSLRVRYTQPLDTKFVAGQLTIIEPLEDGWPEVEIEAEFARFLSTDLSLFRDAHTNDTRLKADITFVGPTLATTNYGLLFQFPNLYIPPGGFTLSVPGGAGQLVPRVRLMALATTTAPTGMTGVTVPMRVVTTGVSSTNPFA